MRITKDTTKNVRKWLAENGFEVGCRLGKDWEYEPNDNIIYMPKGEYDTFFDSDFMAYIRKLGLITDFDCITLSLLHELGHAKTVNKFSNTEWAICALLKMQLSESGADMPSSEYNEKYWNIADEFEAQKWLVKFANNHKKKCQELENIFELYTE